MATNGSPRKVMKAKRILPSVPPESPRLKSVTFNSETVETSIGGTQRVGKIKQDVILHFDKPVTVASKVSSGGVTTPRNGAARSVSSNGHLGKENKNVMKNGSSAAVNGTVESSSNESLGSNNSYSGDESSSDTYNTSSNLSKPQGSGFAISTSAPKSSKTEVNGVKNNPGVHPKQQGLYKNSLSKTQRQKEPTTQKRVNEHNAQRESSSEENSQISSGKFSPSSEAAGLVLPAELQCEDSQQNIPKSNDCPMKKSTDIIHKKPPLPDPSSVMEQSADSKQSIKNSERSSRPSNDPSNRRTTIERIDKVCQSPFITPDRKQSRRHTLESRLFSTPDCYRDVAFGTPRRLLPTIHDESVDEGTEDAGESSSCSIMVAVRVRPFSQRELSDANTRCVVSMQGNETAVVNDNGAVHRFAYDMSFWSHDQVSGQFSSQEDVYTGLAQPLLGKAFEGYNTCLFAYGQTGSGKSYCIMGHAGEIGIIPRFCEELFARADLLASKKQVKVNVEISFFEIYNEKIHDLLAAGKDKGQKKATLKVREHPVLGPYVEALSTYVVNSFEDVESWITLGNKNRATAATGMNDKSSRSHSVFSIVLTQTKTETIEGQDHDHSVNSKINLVDLAGSERQSHANTSGQRLREGANINKSLLTLGKVISLLAERSVANKKRKIFIPYRDSVLTWLLKESLGGNSKTAMIATISPASQHLEETLSTLRYAHQARSIVNRVHINEDPKAKIIRQLRAEIDRLRGEQEGGGGMNEEALAASMSEIARLRSEMEEMSRSWQERLRQAEARKAEELRQLERAGVTFKVDNRLPNLVNLNEDPQLSEMLLYVLKEGETRVGRDIDDSRHIKLTGALIADKHCVINSHDGQVDITPVGDAPTYVNGNLISETTVLHHADRVILGGDHYFRFNHPMEVQKNKTTPASDNRDIKDFDFAKQELLRVQEARLQAELEAVMEKTRQELNEQKDGYENKLKGLEKVLTKVEETHKEAQSTICTLQKQNMMLEQEVLAGRKRHKLESSLSQQSLEALSLSRSKICEMLEAETKKVAERLDKVRSKRSEIASIPLSSKSSSPLTSTISSPNTDSTSGRDDQVPPSTPRATQQQTQLSTPSRRDLYKVALLVREANKINQYLNTSLVFSREDPPDDADSSQQVQHTQIKVSNSRHRMFTLWTVARFEEKLSQMRDLYQNEDGVSADDDEVFNDPEDVWEKDTSVLSPVSDSNGSKNAPRTTGPLRGTPLMMLRKGSSSSVSSPRSHQEMDVVKACKSVLATIGDNLTALSFEESIMDKVLWTCQRIKDNLQAVMSADATRQTNTAAGDNLWMRPMLLLVSDVPLLASHISLWSSSFDGLDLPLLRDLLAGATDQVKVVGHQATSLLQGCDGYLTSLMSESGQKLTSAVLALCETCGQLALATDSPVLRLDQSARHYSSCQLSGDVSRHFLYGCTRFLMQAVSGGVASLQDCEEKSAGWPNNSLDDSLVCGELSQRLAHVLSCTRELLHRTRASQQSMDLPDTHLSQGGAEIERPPQYYSASYKLQQGLVSSITSVVDSSTLLTESVQSVALGEFVDVKRLERCCELIHRSCQRLMSAAAVTYLVVTQDSEDLTVQGSSEAADFSAEDNPRGKHQGPHKGPHPGRTSSPIPKEGEGVNNHDDSPVVNLASSNTRTSTTTTKCSTSTSQLSSSQSSISVSSVSASSVTSTSALSSTADNTTSLMADTTCAPEEETFTREGDDLAITTSICHYTEVKAKDSNFNNSEVFSRPQRETTLLSREQLQKLESAVSEVAMATTLFVEYAQKMSANLNNSRGDKSSLLTPRGRRLLPKSPEKSVVTPAVKSAHLKKLSVKRTIALASKDGDTP